MKRISFFLVLALLSLLPKSSIAWEETIQFSDHRFSEIQKVVRSCGEMVSETVLDQLEKLAPAPDRNSYWSVFPELSCDPRAYCSVYALKASYWTVRSPNREILLVSPELFQFPKIDLAYSGAGYDNLGFPIEDPVYQSVKLFVIGDLTPALKLVNRSCGGCGPTAITVDTESWAGCLKEQFSRW